VSKAPSPINLCSIDKKGRGLSSLLIQQAQKTNKRRKTSGPSSNNDENDYPHYTVTKAQSREEAFR